MANTPKLLTHGQFAAAAAVIYTSPALTTTIIKEINLCNLGAAVNAVTLRIVDGGGIGVASDNLTDAGMSLAVGETVIRTGSLILEAGDTLVGFATNATQVNYHVGGIQVT